MNSSTKPPGRPPVYRTEEERRKAKKAQDAAYQKKYLEKRRQRYAEDPEYRRKQLERSRAHYRGSAPQPYQPKGFGFNAGRAVEFGSERRVKKNVRYTTMTALSIPQMAEFIGVVGKVLSKWIISGKFPRPEYIDESGVRVFTVDQANRLATVLRNHLNHRSAFRATDKQTVAALHSAFHQK